jgi:hypothetical protein
VYTKSGRFRRFPLTHNVLQAKEITQLIKVALVNVSCSMLFVNFTEKKEVHVTYVSKSLIRGSELRDKRRRIRDPWEWSDECHRDFLSSFYLFGYPSFLVTYLRFYKYVQWYS